MIGSKYILITGLLLKNPTNLIKKLENNRVELEMKTALIIKRGKSSRFIILRSIKRTVLQVEQQILTL
jgi:hypothetical protein